MVPKFKKDILYEQLRQAILAGRYAPGVRLPREIDFARELGVSFITLRSSLGMLEKEQLIVRIPSKGTFVNDPLPTPGAFRTEARKNILLAIPEFSGDVTAENLFNRNLILGAVKQGYLNGCEIIPVCSSETVAAFDARVAGIIWDRPESKFSGVIAKFAAEKVPQIVINRQYPGIPSVTCDYPDALRQAVRHLRGIGHRHIGLIDFDPELAEIFAERQKAFQEQLSLAGIVNTRDYVIFGNRGSNVLLNIANGLRRRPEITALIVSGVFLRALHNYLEEEQIGVPRGMSVIQWGENNEFNQNSEHPYSLLTEPRSTVGQSSVELIAAMLRGECPKPEVKLITGELIMRRGCALPRNWQHAEEV